MYLNIFKTIIVKHEGEPEIKQQLSHVQHGFVIRLNNLILYSCV